MAIQILPPQLANQIAAGEVVERPASIVKECVENSLDAGATHILIDIEQGGAKMIRIQDDGCGIPKNELPLALARHATSKIAQLDDLENIQSLGFRGEALASISSVSRLTLSSRPERQEEAWLVFAEGKEQAVTFEPVAHPVGSTVEIRDLFFNTPARRKFLKAAKTEFQHIQTLVKRIALAHFDVGFTLSHNHKSVLKLPARSSQERRIKDVCGETFAQNALPIQTQYQDYQLQAYVSKPMDGFTDNSLQFIFVNGRMMRDKLIMHAIRQAYEGMISPQQHAGYVVYLTLPPQNFDVNVHPAKHEVRFVESRLVHDFIYQAISDVLQSGFVDTPDYNQIAEQSVQHDYIRPLQTGVNYEASDQVTGSPSSSVVATGSKGAAFGQYTGHHPSRTELKNYAELMNTSDEASRLMTPRCVLLPDLRVLLISDKLEIVSAVDVIELYLQTQCSHSEVATPLLLPVSIKVISAPSIELPEMFDVQYVQQKIIIKRVPSLLRSLPWSQIVGMFGDFDIINLHSLAQSLERNSEIFAQLNEWLYAQPDANAKALDGVANSCRIVSDD